MIATDGVSAVSIAHATDGVDDTSTTDVESRLETANSASVRQAAVELVRLQKGDRTEYERCMPYQNTGKFYRGTSLTTNRCTSQNTRKRKPKLEEAHSNHNAMGVAEATRPLTRAARRQLGATRMAESSAQESKNAAVNKGNVAAEPAKITREAVVRWKCDDACGMTCRFETERTGEAAKGGAGVASDASGNAHDGWTSGATGWSGAGGSDCGANSAEKADSVVVESGEEKASEEVLTDARETLIDTIGLDVIKNADGDEVVMKVSTKTYAVRSSVGAKTEVGGGEGGNVDKLNAFNEFLWAV
ncbi:hypothetical protein JG687_00014575 [Phytophthora cactorum]|uniref:Uncharacterized protein n=1 Tax=Phytophthora cactorum TaxID=29920 RepID=A0A8T1U182_9STRA|nr:hypothetical protein JG687_00014575 [Phytophthora cactorum]